MQRDQALHLLTEHHREIAAFGVTSLRLFGSVARDQARPDSDVDLLVEFAHPVGLFAFIRLRRYLEDILGRPVDLVTPDALKRQLRESILAEAIRAA
jgi:predicted nucleotidyltransferase